MARFIFCNAEKVLGLGGSICFEITNQDFLKTLDGLFKAVLVKLRFSLSKDELGNKILRRQESDKSMVLAAVCVHENDGRSPFDAESVDQGFVLIEIDLDGNEIFLDGKTDIRIGVRNSCQLLATDSEIIIKVHQDQFFLLLRHGLCFGKRGLPLNWFSHNMSPFPVFFESASLRCPGKSGLIVTILLRFTWFVKKILHDLNRLASPATKALSS